jgi:hypothetical protein
MLMEVTNFSDPVVSHLFSIFVKYFMNVLWKMAYRSAVAQECHVRFFMGSTYDLQKPTANNSLSFSTFILIPPIHHDTFVY